MSEPNPPQPNGGVRLPDAAIHGLEITDRMPPELRALVHEYGFPIVHAFIEAKVTSPARIRHLVKACWDGPRSYGDSSRTNGSRRLRPTTLEKLDWLMIQSGSAVSAETVLRLLYQSGLVILALSPTDNMVDASIEATGTMGRPRHGTRLHPDRARGSIHRRHPGAHGFLRRGGPAFGCREEPIARRNDGAASVNGADLALWAKRCRLRTQADAADAAPFARLLDPGGEE